MTRVRTKAVLSSLFEIDMSNNILQFIVFQFYSVQKSGEKQGITTGMATGPPGRPTVSAFLSGKLALM